MELDEDRKAVIVNAANRRCMEGDGIDRIIHVSANRLKEQSLLAKRIEILSSCIYHSSQQ